jgi:membrane protease YdiL (CAAX protease family)
VLVAAALTVLTEISVLAGITPNIEMGGLELSMAVIPALALGAACGERLFGRSSLRRVAAWYWIGTVGLLLALMAVYVFDESFQLFVALVIAALGEELVYRLAAPTVIAVLLMFGGLSNQRARLAGLAIAGAWFVMLPGHHSQMTSGAGPVPFVAYAVFSAALVYRSGSILPMAMAHAIVNLVTVLAWSDTLPADARAISASAVLGMLTLAYGIQQRVAKDSHGHLIDTVTGLQVVEIEEVDGLTLARLTDGSEIPLPDAKDA